MVTQPKAIRIPTQTDALFDLSEQPPLVVSRTFFHTGAAVAGGAQPAPPVMRAATDADGTFRSRRDEGVPALHISVFDNAEAWEHEFLEGAHLLGFEPTPQQWKIADAINAHTLDGEPCFATIGVCVPRRAGKTTSLLAIALGRCKMRENYVVLFTAQSGTKARDRFLAMARTLDRLWKSEYERGFRILKGAGHQVVEFANGSFLQVVPPKQESFRGDEGDLIILDEAQEHDAEVSGELLGAILPVMDTRPGAQLIVAGTAGEHRSGLFWDTLEEGRNGDPATGIVEFAAPATLAADELLTFGNKSWSKAEPIIIAAHPGIGTLTTLAKMQERFRKLPLPQFMREYLGVWPEDYSQSAIDPKMWAKGLLEDFPAKPTSFAIAFDVHPHGTSAAIAAAWRDDDNVPYVVTLAHQPGTDWLVDKLVELARKHRVVIGHDTVGAALVEAEALAKKRPSPRRRPIGYKDVGAMCASIMKEIDAGRLKHATPDESLNDAARGAVKRDLGKGAWAWDRKHSATTDIAPLVAGTIALRIFDTTGMRAGVRMVSSRSLARKAS